MAEPVTIRRIEFLRAFPWLRIGRALGCSLALPAVIIAVMGVLVADWSRWLLLRVLPAVVFSHGFREPAWLGSIPPLQHVLLPFWNFHSGEWPLLVMGVVSALVWSFFGVALCRCAATEFCRDESAPFRGSLQLAIRHLATPLGSLATPLAGTAMLAGLIAVTAIPAFIPGAGAIWLRLLSPVLALMGIAAGMILLILPVLWPLMTAAIAVDDSDGFDAFSRSFSFVTSHPWLTTTIVAVGYAMIWLCTRVIDQGVTTASWFIIWSADWTVSDISLAESLIPATGWWLQLLARAIQTSLFWSLATVGYVFLRQATDGAPLDQLCGYDEPVRAADPFPVVGIPAMTPPTATANSPVAE